MSRLRSNSGACSSYRIPISARRVAGAFPVAPACRVARRATPECNLRDAQLAVAHQPQAHPAQVMDGIALASQFTVRAAQRLSPPVAEAGSVRRPPVQVDRAVMEAMRAGADRRSASARRSSSSGATRRVIRRRGVPLAEALAGQPAAAAAAEQLMRPGPAPATPAGVVDTRVGDTAKDRI